MQSGKIGAFMASSGEEGPWRSESMAVCEGVTLVHTQCNPTRDWVEPSVQDGDSVKLIATFAIAGESGYVAHKGDSVRFRCGQMTLTSFTACSGERRVSAGAFVRQLRVVMAKPALDRYLGDSASQGLSARNGVSKLGEWPIAVGSRALLQPLLAPRHAMLPVDHQIAALTLAAEVLRHVASATDRGGGDDLAARYRLDAVTANKLLHAREVMNTQFDRRLTIQSLCMTVGLNEHTFKNGFRDMFNITPARYLLQLRMQRARVLLESGARVAQVAYATGYEYPSNFSAAFARYFGQAPKSVGSKGRCG